MVDFLMFDEGANLIWDVGLPATCTFDLATAAVGTLVAGNTYSQRTAITGSGYSQNTVAQPTPASRQVVFSLRQWQTLANTDWPAAVRSCVLSDGSKAICAWNLIAGGAARDLSQANTTEQVTPTLGPLTNP